MIVSKSYFLWAVYLSIPSQNRIIHQVESCFAHASKELAKDFVRPRITFNQRGKIAASARLQINELRFNPVLLEDNLQTFIDDVVPHEICHLLAYHLYGRVKPHGKEWQTLMLQLYKRKPVARHQMDVSKVSGRRFIYFCQCGQVELSIRRHNKVERGQQQYICRTCKTVLVNQKPTKTSV